MLNEMRPLIEGALTPAIELVVEVHAGVPPVQADNGQLGVAILNLCINARDAMPSGGKIAVTAQRAKRARDLAAGPYVCLSVVDTGFGMEAETLKKAIEPFFSTKPAGKGTGLGLSSVHGLAKQLGGKFELSSALGKGTTAILWLPQANQINLVGEKSSGTEQPVASLEAGATILVVDDDSLIAMSTVDMLEDLGHNVLEANSARQALEIIDTGQPIDLLMTDHIMPGMTGLELAEIVRLKRPDLSILLATGYAEMPDGAPVNVPRLSKPYQQWQLNEQINRLLVK